MIVTLDRQHQSLARRQLLTDVVYILSHEALRQLKRDGETGLSAVEVFLAAQNFCESLFALPDAAEGLDEEIDDLEDEAQDENDAAIILAVATAQLQARAKQTVGIDIRGIIFRIFERLDGNALLWPLVEQMTAKEDARWMEGKKTDLLNYELKEIERMGGGSEKIRQLFADFVNYSDQMDKDAIKGQLLFLARYNIDHGHAYDKELIALFDKLGIKTTTLLDVKEYVAVKHVESEIQNVERGGIGVNKEYQNR